MRPPQKLLLRTRFAVPQSVRLFTTPPRARRTINDHPVISEGDSSHAIVACNNLMIITIGKPFFDEDVKRMPAKWFLDAGHSPASMKMQELFPHGGRTCRPGITAFSYRERSMISILCLNAAKEDSLVGLGEKDDRAAAKCGFDAFFKEVGVSKGPEAVHLARCQGRELQQHLQPMIDLSTWSRCHSSRRRRSPATFRDAQITAAAITGTPDARTTRLRFLLQCYDGGPENKKPSTSISRSILIA